MTMPLVDMRALLEAGVHFGHQKHRWNPKMAPFIFGDRNGIHIIDLSQTVPYFSRALQVVRDVVAGGGRVLFVGTKRQASPIIAEAAKRCGQYYVNHRWLGGMMTNWQTISKSIKQLKQLNEKLGQEHTGLTKKETLQMTRQRDKLELSLGGIQDMGGLPDLVFVVDTNRDDIAIAEANRLKIPVIGVIDTNSKPDGIDYPVPGNDDATRAIRLYCDLVAGAVLDGIQADLASKGVDLGAADKAPAETVVADETPAETVAEAPAATETTPVVEAEVVAKDAPAEKPAKKAAATKAPAKKAAAAKPAAKKAEEKAPAKKAEAKPAAKKAAAKPAAKIAEEKAPAKKPAAKKAATAKKAPAKKAPAKKAAAKKDAE